MATVVLALVNTSAMSQGVNTSKALVTNEAMHLLLLVRHLFLIASLVTTSEKVLFGRSASGIRRWMLGPG